MLFLEHLIGALFGGILTSIIDIPKIYGGLAGYEGTGAPGLVIGPSLVLLGWIGARLKGRLRRDAYLILVIATLIDVVIQNLIWMKPGWNLILFLPIAAKILLFILHKQEEF